MRLDEKKLESLDSSPVNFENHRRLHSSLYLYSTKLCHSSTQQPILIFNTHVDQPDLIGRSIPCLLPHATPALLLAYYRFHVVLRTYLSSL